MPVSEHRAGRLHRAARALRRTESRVRKPRRGG